MECGNINGKHILEGTKEEFEHFFQIMNIDPNQYRLVKKKSFITYAKNIINFFKYPKNKIINSYIKGFDDKDVYIAYRND